MAGKNTTTIVEPPVFVPIHMKGADEIAGVFGVARGTVVQWTRLGAPIRKIGKKYQANYGELWDWLKNKH